MRYLVQRDYERLITVDDLNQVFDNGSDTTYTIQQRILDTEPAAQEEVSSYLKQRYDVSLIFTDTPVWLVGSTYYGQNRVQYHEPAYSALTVYTTGQRVSQAGNIYSSIAGNAAHAFNVAEWTFICQDYQLFYAIIPQLQYVYNQPYAKNDQVWFTNNHTYTSKYDNNTSLVTNTNSWTDNGVYSITAGTLPTVTAKWTQGDNRNQLLVQHMVDIVLFHAHATINKRNIPELRIMRYDGMDVNQNGGAIGWLKKIATGLINASLPELPPTSLELAFRWGGNNSTIPTPPMTF